MTRKAKESSVYIAVCFVCVMLTAVMMELHVEQGIPDVGSITFNTCHDGCAEKQ